MKIFLKWTGYLTLFLFMLIFIVLLNWESSSYYVLRHIAQVYSDRADIELDIGAISGSLFSETTFENISMWPEYGQPQTYHLKARSIKCSYNLMDLRDGLDQFIRELDCSITDPVFSYDLRAANLPEQTSDQSSQFLIPATLPRLNIHNGSVILTNSTWNTQIRKINSRLRAQETTHELLVDADDIRFNQGGLTRIKTKATSMLHFSNGKIIIDSLEFGDEGISATGLLDLAQIDKGDVELAAELVLAESRMSIAGSVANQLLKARFSTDNFDIGELQRRLGGSGWDLSGTVGAEAELAYNLQSAADLAGSFSFIARDIQANGVDVFTFSGQGNLQDGVLSISTAEAATPHNLVSMRNASVPWALVLAGKAPPIIRATQAEFTAELTDASTLVRLFKLEEAVPEKAALPEMMSLRGKLASGVFQLDGGKVIAGDSSLIISQVKISLPSTAEAFDSLPIEMAARLESSNLTQLARLFSDLPVNGQVTADMKIKGSLKEPRVKIKLAGDRLVINETWLGSMALQGDIDLIQEKPGSLKVARVRISKLTQTNDSGTLALLSPATGAWQAGEFSGQSVFQVDGQGEIALKIAQSPASGVSAEITTSNLDSDGWLENFTANRYFFEDADLKAVCTGLPQKPLLKLTGTIDKVGATDVSLPLAGRFGLQYSANGFDISELSLKSHNGNQLTLTGHLPYDPLNQTPYLDKELSLKGHADFPVLADIASFLAPLGISKGTLMLDMDLAGSMRQPVGHLRLKAENIAPPEALKQYVDSAMNISCVLKAQRDSIVLESATLESTAYSAQASGAWQAGISFFELLQKPNEPLKGEVALDATGKLKDLNFLRKKLPWLRRLEGDIQGDIHVSGPLSASHLKGSFSVHNGEASHTFNFPMLSAINLQGVFDEHSISIKNMRAELGGSPVNFRGSINRGQEIISLDLHVDGKNVLLFRNNDMRIRGDVQLDATGPLEQMVIKGTTGLTGGDYTRNYDFLGKIGASPVPVSEGVSFLFSFPDPPFKDALFDIKITTIEPFQIRNNLIRGVLRPELTLKGTGELPFLLGTIYIDQSRILLPSGRLQIQSGLLRFPEGAPDRPQLDILAQSKIMGYDINVITSGALDDPIITLSSSPALANDDLLLLLLTGQPPKKDIAGGAKGSGTRNVMVYLGRDFLNRWLEDEAGAQDESILDRFELDYGRGVTKSGELMVESAFRLSKQADKKGRTYYLLGEKDKYDAYNYGLKLVFNLE